MFIVDGRNKLGDTVYSRNHYGTYIRQQFIPANPNTVYQQSIRATFTTISQTWRTLTDAQRKAWIQAAFDYKAVNNLADHQVSTGFNFFLKINIYLFYTGQPPASSPLPKHFPNLFPEVTATAAVGTSSVSLHFAPHLVASSDSYLVEATDCLSAGRMVVSTQLRGLAVFTYANVPGVSVSAPWFGRFGALIAGDKLFFKIIPVSTSGYAGIPRHCNCIIAP